MLAGVVNRCTFEPDVERAVQAPGISDMSEDGKSSFTFRCQVCGVTLGIDEANPPADDDIFACNGCGREIGQFGVVKAALIQASKDHIDEIISGTFGKPIKLDWKDRDDQE
jgi:hypothetical protein